MGKANYDRVESAVDEGLLKIKAEHLLHESELASKIHSTPENLRSTREHLAEVAKKREQERRLIAAAMLFDVDRHFRKNKQLYSALGTYHEEFTDLIQSAGSMNEEKWTRLMEIKLKLDAVKEEQKKKEKPVSNDTIIEGEVKKHKTKRINVKETWLPLY